MPRDEAESEPLARHVRELLVHQQRRVRAALADEVVVQPLACDPLELPEQVKLRRLAGDRVRVEDGPRLYDVFDRRLAYLYRADGQSIDAALIEGGYAVAWTREGQHVESLMALE